MIEVNIGCVVVMYMINKIFFHDFDFYIKVNIFATCHTIDTTTISSATTL